MKKEGIEKGQMAGAKIIPFSGVSYEPNDNFQNMLYGFLKETGYIE